jgi:hypothetical protein
MKGSAGRETTSWGDGGVARQRSATDAGNAIETAVRITIISTTCVGETGRNPAAPSVEAPR